MSEDSTYECEGCGNHHPLPKEVGITSLRWMLTAMTLIMSEEKRTRGILHMIEFASEENVKPVPESDEDYEALLDLPASSMMKLLDVFVQTALTGAYENPYTEGEAEPIDEDEVARFRDVLDSLPDVINLDEGEQK